jgi:hypothetical protein
MFVFAETLKSRGKSEGSLLAQLRDAMYCSAAAAVAAVAAAAVAAAASAAASSATSNHC